MGWASGFEAGTRMGKSWIDTYRESERRREIEAAQKEVSSAKTPSNIAYTPEQGENLRGLSQQGYQFEPEYGPNGVPTGAYNIYNPAVTGNVGGGGGGGGGGLSSTVSPVNANIPAGQAVGASASEPVIGTSAGGPYANAGVFVDPSQQVTNVRTGLGPVTEKLAVGTVNIPRSSDVEPSGGERYGRAFPEEQGLQPLSKQQRDSMLLERYADIIAKDDPVRAAQLRLSAAQEARSQTQFEGAQKLQGLQISRETRAETKESGLDAALKSISDDVALTADQRQKAITAAIGQYKGPEAALEFTNKGTSAKLNEASLASVTRTLEEGKLKDRFNAAVLEQRAANPNFGTKDMLKLATDMGLPLDVQDSYAAAMANINKNSITIFK